MSVTYSDRAAALLAKRDIEQRFTLIARIHFCEACDAFHLEAEIDGARMNARENLECLTLFAIGYRGAEIAQMLGVTEHVVVRRMRRMMHRFGALSISHLVAIAISLGLIDVAALISPQAHRGHEWRVPRKWRSAASGPYVNRAYQKQRLAARPLGPDNIQVENTRIEKEGRHTNVSTNGHRPAVV